MTKVRKAKFDEGREKLTKNEIEKGGKNLRGQEIFISEEVKDSERERERDCCLSTQKDEVQKRTFTPIGDELAYDQTSGMEPRSYREIAFVRSMTCSCQPHGKQSRERKRSISLKQKCGRIPD